MKKAILLIILLISAPLFGQFYSGESRFVISERFTTAQEAVDYANSLKLTDLASAQFVTEFDARSTSPASYVVIIDRTSWFRQLYPVVGIGKWEFYEEVPLNNAVNFVNDLRRKVRSNDINIRAQFVGYWNPYKNPHGTTVTTFFVPVLAGGNCNYAIVEEDLGAPSEALKKTRQLKDISRVEFVTQFNVGNSVFGSLWVVSAKCTQAGHNGGTWQLVENDEKGNTFSIESAVEYVDSRGYRFARFVSFTSPSQYDSKSRVLIFYQN